jgi:hypothetical protein
MRGGRMEQSKRIASLGDFNAQATRSSTVAEIRARRCASQRPDGKHVMISKL